MQVIKIEPLELKDYNKCSNIWNMKAQPLAENGVKKSQMVTDLFSFTKSIVSL